MGEASELFNIGSIRGYHGDDLSSVVLRPGLARKAQRLPVQDADQLWMERRVRDSGAPKYQTRTAVRIDWPYAIATMSKVNENPNSK